MQDLVTFLSTRISYEEDPTCIFSEKFPQFKAMYNFIAPIIRYIDHIIVLNFNTYVIYFVLPLKLFYDIFENKTIEIDGQVYRSIVKLDMYSLILTIKEEDS